MWLTLFDGAEVVLRPDEIAFVPLVSKNDKILFTCTTSLAPPSKHTDAQF